MPVGLVLVSHSARIAEGVVEVARQMAPDVPLEAAGGAADGGVGTDAAAIERAIRAADGDAGVLVIGDLGSAILTAETVVDLLEPPPSGEVRVVDVPIVEGGVAAAVAAQSGGDLDAVARAAAGADPEAAARPAGVRASVVLTDPEGLHARPAAQLVRTVGRFDATVAVGGADARSLLAVLALGLRQGAEVEVTAAGREAEAALAAAVAALGA